MLKVFSRSSNLGDNEKVTQAREMSKIVRCSEFYTAFHLEGKLSLVEVRSFKNMAFEVLTPFFLLAFMNLRIVLHIQNPRESDYLKVYELNESKRKVTLIPGFIFVTHSFNRWIYFFLKKLTTYKVIWARTLMFLLSKWDWDMNWKVTVLTWIDQVRSMILKVVDTRCIVLWSFLFLY